MYRSTKRFPHAISVAFRQWRADSHCSFLHGYGLSVELVFESAQLDYRNWVVDFGGLRGFKASLEAALDHKTAVAHDDPLMEQFEALDAAGGCQLVVLPEISCECFAEHIYNHLLSSWRMPPGVRIVEVRVEEHESNSASFLPSQDDRDPARTGDPNDAISDFEFRAGGRDHFTRRLAQIETAVSDQAVDAPGRGLGSVIHESGGRDAGLHQSDVNDWAPPPSGRRRYYDAGEARSPRRIRY